MLRLRLSSRLVRAVLVVGVSLMAGAVIAYSAGVHLNTSGSIPPGLYRRSDESIARGAIVLACLPPPIAAFARDRGYVPAGSCGDGSAPVGKVIAAVEGDTVSVTARGVTVNGQLLKNSAPLADDSHGRRLPELRVAPGVVPSGQVWLVSSYSGSSFDSRYFGGIPRGRILSRIQPLLTAR